MKKIKKIIVLIIVVICAFVYAHITKMNLIYDKTIDSSEYLSMGAIGGAEVEQTFQCHENTLDGIEVKCQILGEVSDVIVHYNLVDNESGVVVAEGEKAASEIESTKFNPFVFDTVTECKEKSYKFVIWSENTTDTDGVSFYYQEGVEDETGLVIDGNDTQGTMIMRTMTDRFDVETFSIVMLFAAFIYGFMKFLYKLFK